MSNYDDEIKAYNMQLATTFTKVELTDYITELHNRFCTDIDISFMTYFMELVEHEHEFIVEHAKLIEFGVSGANTSGMIKRMLNQYKFEEDKHFRLCSVAQSRIPGQRGGSNGNKKSLYTYAIYI